MHRLSEIKMAENEKIHFDTANEHLEHEQADLEKEGEFDDSLLNEVTQNKKPRTDDKDFNKNN
eukprot:7074741-Heterocapsa_arctica.AAC.1